MAEYITPTSTAKPKTFSLYDKQVSFLETEATRLAAKSGKPCNPSKVVQKLIDEAMKKAEKQCPINQ